MPKWTKGTYEGVAQIFSDCREELDSHVFVSKSAKAIGTDTVEGIAHRMADAFEDDNPRFDRARFLDACGI